jgi:hypothetical protein
MHNIYICIYGVMVSIAAFQAVGSGSIPDICIYIFLHFLLLIFNINSNIQT